MEEIRKDRNTGKSVFLGQKNCILTKPPGRSKPEKAEAIIG
jgi:hypothetical protein